MIISAQVVASNKQQNKW